jgi:hypothetical protein
MMGRLTEPNDLIPYVGEGKLSLPTFISFMQKIEALKNSPEKRAQAKRLGDVITGFRKPIITNAITGDQDGPGQRNYDSFLFETEKLFFEGIEDGKTTDQLLNPNSKDYIINNGAYMRDRQTMMEDARLSYGFKPEPKRDENGEVVVEDGQRRPGEIDDDFLERTK